MMVFHSYVKLSEGNHGDSWTVPFSHQAWPAEKKSEGVVRREIIELSGGFSMTIFLQEGNCEHVIGT